MLTKKTMCVLTSIAMAIAGTFADTVVPALVDLNDIPGDTKILTNAVEYINSVAGGGGGGADMGAVTGVVNDAIAEFSRTNAVLSGGPYASLDDLNYGMIEPGEWEFSGSGYDQTKTYTIDEYEFEGVWAYDLYDNDSGLFIASTVNNERINTLFFQSVDITATRASLPDHLLNRSINLVSISSTQTLYFPSIVTNKSRDFIVSMYVSGGSQSVTFAGNNGETITWAKDAPPATFDAGTNIIRFTEVSQSCFLYQKLPAEGGGGSGGDVSYITDGTNTIDAAGNVYYIGQTNSVWIWRGDTDYGQPIWKKADEYDDWFWWSEGLMSEPMSQTPNGQNATNLVFLLDDNVFASCYRVFLHAKIYVGKLALTNDIPPAVTVVAPSTNAASGTAADAKATGTALWTGFTEWEISGIPEVVKSEYDIIYLSWSDIDEGWNLNFNKGMDSWATSTDGSIDDTSLVFTDVWDDKSGITFTATATRHLITPTKTSQLVNDGTNGSPFFASSGGVVRGAVTIYGGFAQGCADNSASGFCSHAEGTNTVASERFAHSEGFRTIASGVAAKASGLYSKASGRSSIAIGANSNASNNFSFVWNGFDNGPTGLFYGSHGNSTFNINPQNGLSGVWIGETNLQNHIRAAMSSKADISDLSYSMVEPGEWEFSYLPSGVTGTNMTYYNGEWTLYLTYGDETDSLSTSGSEDDLVVVFSYITATRPSLPGHLFNRANNMVKSSDTLQITLPPPIPNKSRDFRVRLVIDFPITSPITFVGATTNGVQESISFETENGTFPTLNTISTNILHFAETAPSIFYISNKSVSPAPAP